MVGRSEILGASILIVDDQDINIRLLKGILGGAGYTSVTSTADPLAGLRTSSQTPLRPDHARSAHAGHGRLQGDGGLKEIEADGYLPVLVITAEPEHKLRALQAGAKDFISKPFDLAEVLARVHNMLEVRLLHLETKTLYDKLVAEHQRLIELERPAGRHGGRGKGRASRQALVPEPVAASTAGCSST
jgi:CheY-like chemotaxis protein